MELLIDDAPSVLVTDLMMGADRQDGFRLIEQVRGRPELGRIARRGPHRVTSSHDLARARAAGADVCLTKPIDVAEFLRVLREVTASTRASGTAG